MEPLYGSLAELYDKIYTWKNYGEEAAKLGALLHREGVEPGAKILDAACGTGGHVVELHATYRVTGFDRSDAMLAVARKKAPGVSFFEGDMRSFTAPEA